MTPTSRGLLAAATLVLAGCGKDQPVRQAAPQAAPARLESSIALPGNDGRVHIIAVQGELGEVHRCIVAVSATGAVSTSCPTKDLILPDN